VKRSARRLALLACVAGIGLSGAVVAQQSLLPPGFDDKPASAPSRAPRPAAAAPAARAASAPAKPAVAAAKPAAAPTPAAPATATAVVQPLPEDTGVTAAPRAVAAGVDNLDDIDPALIDQLVQSAQPKYDIPPQAQRSLDRVGFLAQQDGGLPATSTHYLNGPFVEGVLGKISGPLVSRWGHILLRRTLASRLDTPVGMNGADWAALRAALLLRMGEADAARDLVQSVDSGSYTRSLEDAALSSFLATADPVGICPVVALTAANHPGWDWDLSRSICAAFTGGEGSPAMAQLDRAMRRGAGAKVDILLAEKFAGAASKARRAVTLEWADVDGLTPWRTGLAFATGIEPRETLRKPAGAAYSLLATRAPMLPLASRAAAADVAAARGVLSSAAMVDLYAEIAALDDPDATWGPLATQLRAAYVSDSESDRLSAIKGLWGDDSDPDRAYSRLVLTAYAAARMVPNDGLADDAESLIASMLTAGLDRNATRWAAVVPAGSEAWGLLALASPAKPAAVSADNLSAFQGNDNSTGALRSQFLLAGLLGLGRVEPAVGQTFAGKVKVDLGRQTRWTRAIDAAADSGNPALVSMLAAFGMQGANWDKMTAVHLYHIVSALRRVGLDGEARMIAAEAVSRV
jgi:hypothetical protein